MEISDLKDRVGWVVFTYPDQTVKVIKTTTNADLLTPVLNKKKPRTMYDLDKRRWVGLPRTEDIKIEVFDSPPQLGAEMQFVNRFI